VIVEVDPVQLAAAAVAEARLHPPRSPERRAAAALWVALTDTGTIAAARRALSGFATPEVERAAVELLHRLAAELARTDDTTERTSP
jgi:hypothetical protein